MPETRRREILMKNLDQSKIVVVFPRIGFKNDFMKKVDFGFKILKNFLKVYIKIYKKNYKFLQY